MTQLTPNAFETEAKNKKRISMLERPKSLRHLCRAALLTLLSLASVCADELPSPDAVRAAMRKAVEFFITHASLEGGYQDSYATDMSWGRSPKNARGRQQFSVVPSATPGVGLAFLDAWEATGERQFLDAARQACYALVHGQLCSGGWDYVINLDPQKRKRSAYRVEVGDDCPTTPMDKRSNVTNLDNNTTPGALRLMMRTDWAFEFKDARIHEATRYAFDKIIAAQYPNGAWAQRFDVPPDPAGFPVKRASYPESWPQEWPGNTYYLHYTFNDDAIVHVIDVLFEAAKIYNEPRYAAAAEKAGDFIILAQMPEPQPAWAQQYNAEMHPAWARVFEPPAVSGRESTDVMKGLLLLYRETGKKKYLEPIPRALAFLKRSTYERDGRKVFARFHELRTNRPLYVTAGDRVESDPLKELRNRNLDTLDLEPGAGKNFRWWLNGYKLTRADAGVGHYSLVTSASTLPPIEAEYERLVKADPSTLVRPRKLRSSQPVKVLGVQREPTAAELAPQVREAMADLDERGAWVRRGLLDQNQFLKVIPAGEMCIYINGQVFPLTKRDDFRIFRGNAPPPALVVSSGTFAHNMRLLGQYLRARAAGR